MKLLNQPFRQYFREARLGIALLFLVSRPMNTITFVASATA